jgi:hypothetical protein
MNKSADFIGQPVPSQLLSLMARPFIHQTIKEHKANCCYKKLFLWDHLVIMLYVIYTHCTSLRELQHGLEICQGKLNHLKLDRMPPRSTLSDGNMNRPSKVFGSSFTNTSNNFPTTLSLLLIKPVLTTSSFMRLQQTNIYYATRQKDNADYTSIEEFDLPDDAPNILKDERIEITYTTDQLVFKQQMCRVAVCSAKYRKAFVYITNH